MPPDMRVINSGVSFHDEPDVSRVHARERESPECLWAAFVAAQHRSKRTLALIAAGTPTAPS